MVIYAMKVDLYFHSRQHHTISEITYTISGRMAIYAMKVDLYFHSKRTSYSACRLAGRMAIHTMKVEDFHSKQHHTIPEITYTISGHMVFGM